MTFEQIAIKKESREYYIGKKFNKKQYRLDIAEALLNEYNISDEKMISNIMEIVNVRPNFYLHVLYGLNHLQGVEKIAKILTEKKN